MLKNKKIIIGLIIGLLIIVNLITNLKWFYSLFYHDSESIYVQSDFVISNNAYEITNINKHVDAIQIIYEKVPKEIMIEFTNDDFINYKHFNSNYYQNRITSDNTYINFSLKGKINNLRITTNNGTIYRVIINPKVPYKLNLLETLLVTLIIIGIVYIFKGDNDPLNLKNQNQKIKCIIAISIICLVAINYYCCNHTKGTYSFYNVYYTDALISHRLDLNVKMDENLLNSSNPYDSSNRNFEYILDASYYNGKYYCYFGILPNILLFVPYRILTEGYMTNAFGCIVYTLLAIMATYLLYKEIIKKYFKNIKFKTFILTFAYVIFGSKLLWCMHRPNFYELVVIAAYFHVIIGLYLVLFNNKESKIREFIGYTFLASAVLCRPTALLASVFIIPTIIDKLKKYKFKITTWLPLVIPYLVIGIITMYINYVRFGSILDFGVSYQLASNNLSAGNFSLINGLVGLFYYLFATYNIRLIPISIISVTNAFPIITDFNVEDIGGGVMTTSLLGFMFFFLPYLIRFIKEKKLKTYLIIASILAIVMIFISSSIGASIGRYMLDFNYLIYFVIIVISFSFLQKENNKVLNIAYISIITASIIINFLLSLSNIY